MKTRTQLIIIAILLSFALIPLETGWAASFSVAPVRVKLDRQHRTERLAVTNESDLPLTLLVKTYRWTQAERGLDHYEETADLIVFPRVLILAAKEERFIRVGIASPPGLQEQAFRIYLEEQPTDDESAPSGASGRILMRVGIPVFAQPQSPAADLKITELSITKGILRFSLVNRGNSFVMAEQITITGSDDKEAELFVKNLGGIYLLSGIKRIFEVTLTGEQCRRSGRISVTTRSEGKQLHDILNMPLAACEGL